MIGEYKFMKTDRGGTKFTKIKVDLKTADQWATEWSVKVYPNDREVLEAGLNYALKILYKVNKQKYTVTVLDIFISMVDSTPDAMFCAAALVVFKTAGIKNDQFELVNNNGNWEVIFLES